jgi:hypothetical protein
MADRLQVVPTALPAPPYPADTSARGFTFSLHPRRIKASDTWALAAPELRPWLLMLWFESWEQIPCGSFPDDPELIAARIGMPLVMFQTHCKVLMRGWRPHSDRRLYHQVVSALVLDRIEWQENEKKRKKEWREKQGVTRMSHGTDAERHVADDTGAGAGAGAGASTIKTKVKNIAPRTASRLSPGWELPEAWLNWATGSAGIPEEKATRESLIFRDYWLGKAGQNGTKVDWFATWRNWIRRVAT